MIYDHYTDLSPRLWGWSSFTPREMSCKCCGEFYYSPVFMNSLQELRDIRDAPIVVHSGHRCRLHNARVGGAPMSQHKHIAADVGLAGHEPQDLLNDAKEAGFTSFGFYKTFLHMDLRPGRRWIAKGADAIWNF